MIIRPLRIEHIDAVQELIAMSGPYVWARTPSDYWLYAELFSATCPVAFNDDELAGVVIAFRSQAKPDDVYVQDVVTHPHQRRRGVAQALLDSVRHQATAWGCRRLYLTSEPENHAARLTWQTLGFTNVIGDHTVDGVSVTSNYKGPGKHRAIYELIVRPPDTSQQS